MEAKLSSIFSWRKAKYKMSISKTLNYFLNLNKWFNACKHPQTTLQTLSIILFHHQCFKVFQNVEGLISLNLGTLLYESVLQNNSPSTNVIEVGAFKGASTCYLSLAAVQIGKRVKSFELFSGLPVADTMLDPTFHIGQYSSDVVEYEQNVKAWGHRGSVDLIIGDARQTLSSTIVGKGFSVAFLDVDVYEVMKELLSLLWTEAKGGEIIIVHDINSPGIRKAADEFHILTKHLWKETVVDNGIASIFTL